MSLFDRRPPAIHVAEGNPQLESIFFTERDNCTDPSLRSWRLTSELMEVSGKVVGNDQRLHMRELLCQRDKARSTCARANA